MQERQAKARGSGRNVLPQRRRNQVSAARGYELGEKRHDLFGAGGMTPRRRGKADVRDEGPTSDTRRVRHADEGATPRELGPGEDIPGADLRVVSKIGEGGFGRVYECTDMHLKVPVAVKLLHADVDRNPEVEHIFASEAMTLAGLDSDFIVRVRRFGFTKEARPRPFLVMFKLEGSTLLEVLSTLGRLSVHDTLLYGIHVGIGLSVAHAKNLVHRDIKPANIFLARVVDPLGASHATRAVILDFGIARTASTGASKATGFFGSHPYAAPEQYYGRALPQSDIYALATVMFIMLTGQHPLGVMESDRAWVLAKLKGTHPMRRVNEVIRAYNRGRAPEKRVAEVDVELEELLARSLAFNPEERPGTAEAFVRALEIIVERERERLDELEARKGNKKPVRGARTVPEPPTWMAARITEHYQSTGMTPEPSHTDERAGFSPEERRVPTPSRNVVANRVPTEELGPSGLPVSVDPRDPRNFGKIDELSHLGPEERSRRLMLAGGTLESPHAAIRQVARERSTSPRVTFAPGADRTAPLPADRGYRSKARYSSMAEPAISIPMSGPFGWVRKLKARVLSPDERRPLRIAGLVLPASFFVTAMAVVVVVLSVRAIRSRHAAASAGPEAVAAPTTSAAVPSTAGSLASRSDVAMAPSVTPPVGASASQAAEVVAVPTASAPALPAPVSGQNSQNVAHGGHGPQKAGPRPPAPTTPGTAGKGVATRPSASPGAPSSASPCTYCGLIDPPKPSASSDITHKID